MLGSRCHAVVTVAWHTHCKQSPDVLLTHRAKELRRAASLSWRQRHSLGWSSPFQAQCWTLLLLPCPCYKNAMSASSTSTVPVCQTPLLWLSLFVKSVSLQFFFAPVSVILCFFIWFLQYPTNSSLVASLHHPKLCSFSWNLPCQY